MAENRPPRRGLGRGLSALLGEGTADAPRQDGTDVRVVAVDAIAPNPDQPRRRVDDAALDALAESIRQHGLMQPAVVRSVDGQRFEIIAGERRWRAAQRAGLQEMPVVVRHADARALLELALVENMVRQDLSPIEVANAVATLVEDFGQTHQQVADHLGRSRPAVSNLLRLLELPDDIQAHVDRGELSEGHARALLMADGTKARRRLAAEAMAKSWSVRELEQRARGAAPAPSPSVRERDQAEDPLVDEALDAITAAFEAVVRVSGNRTGYRVEMRFADADALRRALASLPPRSRGF